MRRRAQKTFAAILISTLSTSFLHAQQNRPAQNPPGKSSSQAGGVKAKLSDKERQAERARELYADAAVAQNNFAFDLAIENWTKMLREFPNDSLASSARHFLGMCYIQKDMPDFDSAIEQFRLALQDPELKQREESLGNLGWSLFQKSILSEDNGSKESLSEAAKVLAVVIDKYPDSRSLDRSLLHAAEVESRLGNRQRALLLYKQLIQTKRLEGSSVRPDAIFGMAITYEEMEQPKLARETFDQFLTGFANHAYANDVRIRYADLALASDEPKKAVEILEPLVSNSNLSKIANADYALYRYGFALAKSGRFEDSAAAYKKLADLFPSSSFAKNSSLAAGQALMREKKYDEALRAFEALLPLKDERSAEAAHWICQIKLLQGKPQEVVDAAKSALAWVGKSPTQVLLKMDLADGMSSLPAQRAEAKRLYEQLATEYPDDPIAPRATYNAAFTSLQLGALADAQRWSEAFFKRFSNDPLAADVAYVGAESTLQLGQYDSAVNAFEQLIASQPNDPLVTTWQLRLASALNLASQHEKGISLCDKLLSQKIDAPVQAEVLYLKGLSLFKTQKINEAIEAFTKSVAASSDWPQADEAAVQLGESLVNAGRTKEAIAALQQAIAKFPQSRLRGQTELRIAQLAADAGDFKTAMTAYDNVLQSSQSKSQWNYAKFGKAFITMQNGDYKAALELLNPVCDSNDNDFLVTEARIAKAICLRKGGDASQAIGLLSSIQESVQGTQKWNVLYELGLSQVAAKKNNDAVDTFKKLIASAKDFPLIDEALLELGFAYKAIGNPQDAITAFQTVVDKYPASKNVAEASFQIGQSEYESSKFDSAIKAYTVAATKGSSGSVQEKSLYKLGWSFYQQNDVASAESQFRKQLKDYPNGPLANDGRFMIAECLLAKEDFEGAFKEYNLIRSRLEKDPNNASLSEQAQALVYLHGAQAASKLKKWNEAESLANALITKFSDSKYKPYALYELAFAKQKQRKAKEAVDLYTQVAENYREEIGAHARFMIGEVLFTEGDHAKAITEFQKVMYGYGGTQAPKEIRNWQALAAWEAGRCSEVLISDLKGETRTKAIGVSKKFYEFVVNNHSDHEIAKQAQERLAELSR
ncbi:MAG: tetratricopeptide repeat protein [Pirellula sp.]|nr:tetratricopeptide repeat protein [Pirellula sp.]